MPLEIFKANCPGCGAEVPFRSATSVMAVCGYCSTLVLKQGNDVASAGKLSAVFEDYTPLQIGTSGIYNGVGFTLIGRLQLTYDDGRWNEWYALFDDGTGGWLADASGQYVFTREVPLDTTPPLFDKLAAGSRWQCGGITWFAADVRSAQARAGQGELPFAIGEGWVAKVADFRAGGKFLTLDYSFGDTPQVFRGEAVTLDGMRCQLLRDDAQIVDSAGRYKGALTKLECPQCGSPIAYAPGLSRGAVCGACHSELALDDDKAEVLATHDTVAAQHTTLTLGETASIDGVTWVLIGLMVANNPEEDETWTEYLLFNARAGFLWLVESSEGWQRVRVEEVWPEAISDSEVTWRGRRLTRKWTYPAEVTFAAGAFNWRVRVGEMRQITDYGDARQTLTRELTAQEMNFSVAERVTAAAVGQWFKRPDVIEPAGATAASMLRNFSGSGGGGGGGSGGSGGSGGGGSAADLGKAFFYASVILWLINLPLVAFGDGSLFLTGFAQAAVVPAIAQKMVGSASAKAPYIAFSAFVVFLATLLNLSGDGSSGPSRSWGSGGSGFSTSGGHK